MTEVSRLLRGTLPVLVALAVATGFALPANAAPLARAPRMSGPDLASQWWLTSLHVPQAWRGRVREGRGRDRRGAVHRGQRQPAGPVRRGADRPGLRRLRPRRGRAVLGFRGHGGGRA